MLAIKPKYILRLDEASPSNNTIRGMHPHAYKKDRWNWRCAILAQLGAAPVKPIESSFLWIRRYSQGELDWDNAYGGLKIVLDCLVQASKRNPDGLGLIVDDSPKHMPQPPYVEQLKAKRNEGKTEIFVFDIETLPAGWANSWGLNQSVEILGELAA